MMKTSFEIDGIVIDLLSKSIANKKLRISGGVYYQNDRPDGSHDEDIVVSTIATTQDSLPQLATSNINIYVADMKCNINKVEQLKPNNRRLAELTKKVLEVLREANVDGLLFTPESQSILRESSVNQHYSNIRITWNIQIDD